MTPRVALESTVITHGLPRPRNLEAARRMCAAVRRNGAEPALIAIRHGEPVIGLSDAEIEALAALSEVRKCSLRDLPVLGKTREDGGTTVSATLHLALRAGIPVFATGGIGGVHRGDEDDISADLPALASLPGLVVCSGAKSILDLPRTRERLETDGVTVLGWRCDEFPAFTSRSSGLAVDQRVEIAAEVAEMMRYRDQLGLRAAILLTVPCPEAPALPAGEIEPLLEQALSEASRQNIRGKALTPFLLSWMAKATEGRSLEANLALLENNAAVAAEVAVAFCKLFRNNSHIQSSESL